MLRNVIWNGSLSTSTLKAGDVHVTPQGGCSPCAAVPMVQPLQLCTSTVARIGWAGWHSLHRHTLPEPRTEA